MYRVHEWQPADECECIIESLCLDGLPASDGIPIRPVRLLATVAGKRTHGVVGLPFRSVQRAGVAGRLPLEIAVLGIRGPLDVVAG